MKRLLIIGFVGLFAAGCSTFGHGTPQTYNVFFPTGTSVLTGPGTQIVDSAAQTINASHPGTVMVSAGTAPGDNLVYAEARYNAVRAELVAKGVSNDVIARATLTELPAELGPTADRRVEIKLLKDRSP